jgi:hypothetical protein
MTTTISTMQELERVPEGTAISVVTPAGIHPSAPRVWTMRGGRLHLDGAALDPVHFQSAINDGLITVGTTIQRGQVYRSADNSASWYVLDPSTEDGRWAVLITSNGSFYDLNTATREVPRNAVLVTDMASRPQHQVDFDNFAFSMGRMAMNHINRSRELTEAQSQTAPVQDQSGTVRHLEGRIENLNEALISYHADVLSDTDERSELVELMVNHDLRAPTRQVELRVEVSGYTQVSGEYMGSESLRDIADLPSLDSFSGGGSIEVNWEHQFIKVEEYTGTEENPCQDYDWVDDDMVRNWLDDMGVEYESFEITDRNCDHC